MKTLQMSPENSKVFVRLGALVEVNTQEFMRDPANALKEAALAGKITLDGQSYVPEGGIVQELEYQDVILSEFPDRHEDIKENYEITFDC